MLVFPCLRCSGFYSMLTNVESVKRKMTKKDNEKKKN
jgi:hypothetical protein